MAATNLHEMSNIRKHGAPAASGDMSTFWTEVTAIQDLLREYSDNVSRISDLQHRSLNNLGDTQASSQLEGIVATNRKLSNELKERIKALQRTGGDSREGQTRRNQAALLKEKFQTALQNYQQVETRQRNASKGQLERQYRVVNPNASPDEVRAALDNSNGQIFQQALLNSDQYGRSRAAYKEVQERHDDILKITKTMAELHQLMNEMALIVEEDGEKILAIEKQTEGVEKDVEGGHKHTVEARKSAVSARQKRWICLVIVLILIVIITLVGIKAACPTLNFSKCYP